MLVQKYLETTATGIDIANGTGTILIIERLLLMQTQT